jgi:cyclophilin family peptidyl-prolyl cis-trans isomerase
MEAFVLICALALSVNAQTPIISSQPQSITNNSGSTASFSVTASNAVKYQWMLNGGNIAGATNSTYTFEDVTTNQAGAYVVEVTSSHGQATNSQPAQLTVVQGTMVQIAFSGFPDGSTSNVLVELFDHDKPATVANFLHYITPAVIPGVATNVILSNMFWDRCVPGFVLQGGDFCATNGVNATALEYTNVGSLIATNYTPAFALQVDNEFNFGPLIHNTFGTISMAKEAGNPDSAKTAFFFNLANNSSMLDSQNGGYTVFGRVVSGSNVLEYFNTLSKPGEGIFDWTIGDTDIGFTDLPVNYRGWSYPANSNLFYGDFTLLSAYQPDTNPPTISIAFPTNGQTMTNAHVVLQGSASDNVGIACVFRPTYLFGLIFEGYQYSVGTTNWSMDFGNQLPPGTNTISVYASDGAGNVVGPTNVTFVVPRFPFTNTVIGNGILSTNYDGTNTDIGTSYTIVATPGKGAVFANWVLDGNASLDETLNFSMNNGSQATATFVSNNLSVGAVSITRPLANAQLTNASVSIEGTVERSAAPAVINCWIFSTSGSSVSSNMVLHATNAWSTPPVPLAPGNYMAQVVATSSNGLTRLLTRDFTILAPLTINSNGRGRFSIPSGTYEYAGSNYVLFAAPEPGQFFLSWWSTSFGTHVLAPSISFPMSAGTEFTATFISNSLPHSLVFDAPAANSQVTASNVVFKGHVASQVNGPQVFCEVFLNGDSYAPLRALSLTNGTNWALPLTNLAMGRYEAVALLNDNAGRTTMATNAFTVNFYPLIAGQYYGLFMPTNSDAISPTNAGSLSFQLNPNASAVGNLVFPVHNYLFLQDFGYSDSSSISGSGFNGTLTFEMGFDLTTFSGEMDGNVSQGGASSPALAYRAVSGLSTNTVPAVGKYVLALESVNPSNGTPIADGFAALSISKDGNMAVAGTLADTTSFSLSTGVHTNLITAQYQTNVITNGTVQTNVTTNFFTNNVWPLCAKLNNGNGILIGWETNLPSGECVGSLHWVRGRSHAGYFPAGVTNTLDSYGAVFVPPQAGTNYQIVFAGGTLETNFLTNFFSFKPAGASWKIIPASGTTDRLAGTLLPTGMFSGAGIVNPVNNKPLPFSGVFISPVLGGAGFTRDAGDATGFFTISKVPE